ncbi:MAG TPA: hypothetical protein VIH91_02920, partial [Terriglobales bacterium]
RTSGSAAPTGLPHDVIPQNRRAPARHEGQHAKEGTITMSDSTPVDTGATIDSLADGGLYHLDYARCLTRRCPAEA